MAGDQSRKEDHWNHILRRVGLLDKDFVSRSKRKIYTNGVSGYYPVQTQTPLVGQLIVPSTYNFHPVSSLKSLNNGNELPLLISLFLFEIPFKIIIRIKFLWLLRFLSVSNIHRTSWEYLILSPLRTIIDIT
jgi:hypothetical protein